MYAVHAVDDTTCTSGACYACACSSAIEHMYVSHTRTHTSDDQDMGPLEECPSCGRRFNQRALEKHAKVYVFPHTLVKHARNACLSWLAFMFTLELEYWAYVMSMYTSMSTHADMCRHAYTSIGRNASSNVYIHAHIT